MNFECATAVAAAYNILAQLYEHLGFNARALRCAMLDSNVGVGCVGGN